jgi:3-oxoadipate enol-lactonase
MTKSLHHIRSGHGQALVLLHPIGLDLTFWKSVAAALSKEYSVVAVDLRGHGDSPAAIRGYALADYADDVSRLIDELSIGPVALLGLSVGGMIAQALTLRRPELVSRLVLCGCPSRFPDEARGQIMERGALAEREGMRAVVEATLGRWFTRQFIERGGSEETRRRLNSDDIAGWASGWRAISTLDTHAHLKNIAVPTLCIAGELDEAVPPVAVETLSFAIPNSRYEIIKDAPHMMQIEQPDRFLTAVRTFLGAGAM